MTIVISKLFIMSILLIVAITTLEHLLISSLFKAKKSLDNNREEYIIYTRKRETATKNDDLNDLIDWMEFYKDNMKHFKNEITFLIIMLIVINFTIIVGFLIYFDILHIVFK